MINKKGINFFTFKAFGGFIPSPYGNKGILSAF